MLDRFDPSTPAPMISEGDFMRCTRMLRERTGIVVGQHRRDVLSRIIALKSHKMGVTSPSAYLDALERQPDSQAWQAFVNACTVNHTAFFREPHHFEVLAKFLRGRRKPVSIWCCAASTGEEPYTIAMTMAETGHRKETGAFVCATDIDTHALEKARAGIYTRERVTAVSEAYLKKYFRRGVASHAGEVRVRSVLSSMVHFQTLNLLDPVWPLKRIGEAKFDVIFCRNTMIYFDKETQARLLDRFAKILKPDGLLFVGHSENFTYISDAFRLCGQTVYALNTADASNPIMP